VTSFRIVIIIVTGGGGGGGGEGCEDSTSGDGVGSSNSG
jgi:hypothetical protein